MMWNGAKVFSPARKQICTMTIQVCHHPTFIVAESDDLTVPSVVLGVFLAYIWLDYILHTVCFRFETLFVFVCDRCVPLCAAAGRQHSQPAGQRGAEPASSSDGQHEG